MRGRRHGWFDGDKAEVVAANEERSERVLRTAQGRWVLERSSSRQDERPECDQLGERVARAWLTANGNDTAVRRYFAGADHGRGRGRPAVGGQVHVRLGELVEQLDSWATTQGIDRAAAVREAVRRRIDEEDYVEKPPDCSCSCEHRRGECVTCGCSCEGTNPDVCPCCGSDDGELDALLPDTTEREDPLLHQD
jgi:hypothetical protein